MNVNVEAKRVMVFGDSLSWGYQPGTQHLRYDAQTRWPGRLQLLLGDDFEIIEENLNSRGIENGDPRPGKEGRRALDYIEAALDSHDPLDLVIVLLGTNELKHEMAMTADEVGRSMEKLLRVIKARPSQFRDKKPDIFLLSPPILNENTEYCRNGNKYLGATQKSEELSAVYQSLAASLGIGFVALSEISPGVDGVHIDENGHARVAKLVHDALVSSTFVTQAASG